MGQYSIISFTRVKQIITHFILYVLAVAEVGKELKCHPLCLENLEGRGGRGWRGGGGERRTQKKRRGFS